MKIIKIIVAAIMASFMVGSGVVVRSCQDDAAAHHVMRGAMTDRMCRPQLMCTAVDTQCGPLPKCTNNM